MNDEDKMVSGLIAESFRELFDFLKKAKVVKYEFGNDTNEGFVYNVDGIFSKKLLEESVKSYWIIGYRNLLKGLLRSRTENFLDLENARELSESYFFGNWETIKQESYREDNVKTIKIDSKETVAAYHAIDNEVFSLRTMEEIIRIVTVGFGSFEAMPWWYEIGMLDLTRNVQKKPKTKPFIECQNIEGLEAIFDELYRFLVRNGYLHSSKDSFLSLFRPSGQQEVVSFSTSSRLGHFFKLIKDDLELTLKRFPLKSLSSHIQVRDIPLTHEKLKELSRNLSDYSEGIFKSEILDSSDGYEVLKKRLKSVNAMKRRGAMGSGKKS
ncbi:hypothetical protein C943_04185 [Mariniradius saccharolyticus AK6]|uniref:Uncharacterized protein n=1 Tax=Mariniradius saccharolyticus AK6 TaxID=1239962 RepID=M7Y9N6_9BACT|nr:hypothetical protein [Mariniradius saccharolyticus]EMS33866.1 hypothetical protein C943_04185 [Mariniradius saccharolyticus AK6]